MGRPPAFDEDEVLTGAMHAFRRKGYRGASVRDLEQATGLKMGSIYNSFGDKAGLFDAAFAHYNASFVRGRIDRFAPPSAGLAGLRALFLSVTEEPGGESYGCLITNSAVELGGAEPAPAWVADGLRLLSDTFAERLAAAQARGELRAGLHPAGTAAKLLALYQGILVLVRAGHDKAVLRHLVIDEFANLEARHDR
ncbi:MAG: TetR/AcrR family transcriptional regulator [Rhodospirillaceae bacterium]|nr:TetR/AcrR family transcriptional regulator [Rhodospirillaceae bacterium]